jgi:hypothetical protein
MVYDLEQVIQAAADPESGDFTPAEGAALVPVFDVKNNQTILFSLGGISSDYAN